MTERERRVLMAIPFAKDGAVRRRTLETRLGISERSIREYIEGLQKQGWPIVNFQDGEGYFFAETAEEVARYKKQERSRARNITAKARGIKFRPDIRDKVAEVRLEK